MKRFLAYVTMAAVLLIFSAGCRRIPLYDRSTRVDIIIDLDRELDHDIVMSVDKKLPVKRLLLVLILLNI